MAGHSQFANIKHRKEAQDGRRAKLFTKAVREIMCAARAGTDQTLNNKLKIAISKARSINLSKDRIDAAIDKVANGSDTTNYSEIRYNATLSDGIAIIIEALTDNKNRTASDVRSLITKSNGNLVETGSIEFMFSRLGEIVYEDNIGDFNAIFSKCIEYGASDISQEKEYYIINTDFASYANINNNLTKDFGDPKSTMIVWNPNNRISIDDDKALSLQKLLNSLNDLDDVSNVFHNADTDF